MFLTKLTRFTAYGFEYVSLHGSVSVLLDCTPSEFANMTLKEECVPSTPPQPLDVRVDPSCYVLAYCSVSLSEIAVM